MKAAINSLLIAGYCCGLVPAAMVAAAFRWLDLTHH